MGSPLSSGFAYGSRSAYANLRFAFQSGSTAHTADLERSVSNHSKPQLYCYVSAVKGFHFVPFSTTTSGFSVTLLNSSRSDVFCIYNLLFIEQYFIEMT